MWPCINDSVFPGFQFPVLPNKSKNSSRTISKICLKEHTDDGLGTDLKTEGTENLGLNDIHLINNFFRIWNIANYKEYANYGTLTASIKWRSEKNNTHWGMHWLIKYHIILIIIIIICIIMKKSSQVEKTHTLSIDYKNHTLNTCFLPPQFCPPVGLFAFMSIPESSWCFGKFYVQFWPI